MKHYTNALLLTACLAGLILAGCEKYDATSVNNFLQTPRESVVSATEYRTFPPDVIAISSRKITELVKPVTQQIRPDGKVNLPLVGEVYVAGKTPKEIEQIVADAFTDYYEQTDAVVNIVGYNSQRFYVFGQVNSPGPKRWTGRDMLLDALASAQPNRLAWAERIWVIRGDKPQVGGHPWSKTNKGSTTYRLYGIQEEEASRPRYRMLVNLAAMYEEGDLSQNILLKPNDIIYVQPNPFAKVGLALQNILYPVTPITSAASAPARVATAGAMP